MTLWTFFSDRDLERWFGASHGGRVLALLRGLLRLGSAWRLVRRSDAVWVLRDAVPVGVAFFERWLLRGRRWVWDVDDAVWQHTSPTAGALPTWLRATPAKYERLCRSATQVWAGSAVLAAWCRQRNAAVELVPTVVPVLPLTPSERDEVTACWVGSHSTTPFLAAVAPALLAQLPTLRIVAVGADETQLQAHERLVSKRWSAQVEENVLEESRVGLYPVDSSHPLADGKCGLKAILYMAHGVPPVVTPTTTNAHIVRDGVDGLHATDNETWVDAVRRLLDDDELLERLRSSGHARAADEYSLEVWTPRVARLLRDLLPG
jgi:hypothetical protein